MPLLKSVYHPPQRSTHGLVRSLMQLMDLDLPAPHAPILSRRASSLDVALPRQSAGKSLHVLVDATGLKVYGEGEWEVRVHGYQKRRAWRKPHPAVGEATAEVSAVVETTSNVSDKGVLPNLLEQIPCEIERLTADGGYDYRSCYEVIAHRGARAVIPPRRTGRIHREDEVPEARDEGLRRIRRGRKKWKRESRYHRRSLVETAMMRVKTVFGGGLKSRRFNNQATGMRVRCAALNRMTQLGMPEGYAI